MRAQFTILSVLALTLIQNSLGYIIVGELEENIASIPDLIENETARIEKIQKKMSQDIYLLDFLIEEDKIAMKYGTERSIKEFQESLAELDRYIAKAAKETSKIATECVEAAVTQRQKANLNNDSILKCSETYALDYLKADLLEMEMMKAEVLTTISTCSSTYLTDEEKLKNCIHKKTDEIQSHFSEANDKFISVAGRVYSDFLNCLDDKENDLIHNVTKIYYSLRNCLKQ